MLSSDMQLIKSSSNENSNPEDNIFYPEFSVDKNGIYSLHFSFKTIEIATTFFASMKYDWGMPVWLQQNRVILKTAKDKNGNELGIVFYSEEEQISDWAPRQAEKLGIRFPAKEYAEIFYTSYACPSLKYLYPEVGIHMPKMKLKDSDISIHKEDIIHEYFFLDLRVLQPKIVIKYNYSHFFAIFQGLININSVIELPNEIMLMILNMGAVLFQDQQYSKLNTTFSLDKQQIAIQNKIVNCHISYAFGPSRSEWEEDQRMLYCSSEKGNDYENLYIFLTCPDDDHAKILFDNIRLHGTFTNLELFRNQIIIFPVINSEINSKNRSGSVEKLYSSFGNMITIAIRNSFDYRIFHDLINFHLPIHEMTGEKFRIYGFSFEFNESCLDQIKLNKPVESRKEIEIKIVFNTTYIYADIDKIIKELEQTNLATCALSFFASDEQIQTKNNIIVCLGLLKNHIKNGILDNISLQESVKIWENSKSPAIRKTISEFILSTEYGKDVMQQIADIVKRYENRNCYQPLIKNKM